MGAWTRFKPSHFCSWLGGGNGNGIFVVRLGDWGGELSAKDTIAIHAILAVARGGGGHQTSFTVKNADDNPGEHVNADDFT